MPDEMAVVSHYVYHVYANTMQDLHVINARKFAFWTVVLSIVS